MLPSQKPSTREAPPSRLRPVPPRPTTAARPRSAVGRTLDALAFSSGLAAAVAALLCWAAALALGVAPPPALIGLAFGGTLAVYNIDRLRDLARDQWTAPARSGFVSRHRARLIALAVGGGAMGVAAAATLGPAVQAACAAVLAIGLLHRRLKHDAHAKSAYVTTAWLAVAVGLPACLPGAALDRAPWVLGIYAGALSANLVATNAPALGDARALRLAAGAAAAGVGVALLAPSDLVPLAWVPLAQLTSLPAHRAGERYRLIGLDGALAMGAALALIALS